MCRWARPCTYEAKGPTGNVAADIHSDATSLDFTISVLDLGTATAPEQAGFVVSSTGGHGFSLVAGRRPSATPTATLWGGPSEGSYATAVPVTYGDTTDTITMTATLATLSDATGTTVQSGSVLCGFSIWTSRWTAVAVVAVGTGTGDTADTSASYTI